MKKLLMLLALLVILFSSGAFAADGDEFSTTNFRINSDGQVVYKQLYEVMTTSDTITAAETGKTFFYNPASTKSTFTLPTAAAGLTFTFVESNGRADTDDRNMILDSASTDQFIGCVYESLDTTTLAGVDVESDGDAGTSITIVGDSTKWYCVGGRGRWTRVNQ